MIKTLIVDKDPQSVASLSQRLSQSSQNVDIIGSYRYLDVALQSIGQQNPDVVFLDVTDRKHDYYRHLEKLKSKNIKIVYLSSTLDRAHEAIKVEASDYLLKPIKKNAVEVALEKINKSIRCQCNLDVKIKFPKSQGIRYISANDIFYIKSNGNYTWIYNNNSDRFHSNYNLKYVEELLNHRLFLRTHNQYVVNLCKVSEFSKRANNDILIMCNGDEIPLSRKKRQLTLELLNMI